MYLILSSLISFQYQQALHPDTDIRLTASFTNTRKNPQFTPIKMVCCYDIVTFQPTDVNDDMANFVIAGASFCLYYSQNDRNHLRILTTDCRSMSPESKSVFTHIFI